tara:strand:+ start:1379 stop:3598 length:2220 start_codon:yes stop_codon:yes gene_type:complete
MDFNMKAKSLFDAEFYLRTNTDVAGSGIDPFTHYSLFGWKEDRDPNVFFSTRFYKTTNPDVDQADKNPLEHYVEFGVQELRDPSPFFDTSIYLQENTDVANGPTNPLEHFILFGNRETRRPSELFDTSFYLANNADVTALVNGLQTTALEHFILFGHKEGRDPSANFNTALYLEANLDVAASDYTAFEHYQYAGKNEARRIDENFIIPLGTKTTTTGVSLAENITGNSEANAINGAGGNDILFGKAGADTIDGGSGDDTISGDEGADILSGGSGNDTINGGAGADVIVANEGNDTINGDAGDDTLTANSGDNVLVGGAGSDTINAGTGDDVITGGAGNDTINLLTTVGNGTDTIVYSGRTDNLNGSDTIATFQTDDIHDFSNLLNSGAIVNLTGSSIVLASTTALSTQATSIAISDETLYIAEVAAKADIETPAKLVTALTDNGVLDAVDLAADSDAVLVLGGSDDDATQYIYGIDNDSTPALVADEITLISTVTTDIKDGIQGLLETNFTFVTSGNNADNRINGTSGNDVINGGAGDDILNGLGGNDTIFAGTGADLITGGIGNDSINLSTVAASGIDTIVFSGLTSSTNGSDTIATFQTNDKFNFSNLLSSGAITNLSSNTITIASTTALSTEETSINILDEKAYIAEVALENTIDTEAKISIALTDNGVLDALDFDANADAILIIGGANDDNTHYVYGIDNNSVATVLSSEVTLLGTVTTDITNGIQGLLVDNFIF